ncbi:putative G-protein coupled receptor 34b [Pholidichthys leucotaenia]
MIKNKITTLSSQPAVTPSINASCVDFDALQLPLAVLYTIIFVLGLVGNLVALWVFFCVHSKKNSVWVFLINIAFADLLLVACLPFRILYHIHGNIWMLSTAPCKVAGILFYMNMYISITLLGLISVDRYLKLHRSAGVQHRLHTMQCSSSICAAVWMVALVFTFVMLGLMDYSEKENRCFHYKQLLDKKWQAYINIFLLVLFWLVFFALIVSYGKIARKLQMQSRENPDLPNATCYARTAKKSFFVLFIFTVCFLPYHLVRGFYIKTQITETSCYLMNVADRANEIALIFSAFNSCLDPIMYFLLSSSVRKEVHRMLNKVLCAQDDAPISGISSTADLDSKNGRSDKGQTNTRVLYVS